ncbi:MAG TPA: FadR/GntR family transcriptional regulator [Thermoanaerobaculia bacterium]|jgi:GntR family transcriptional repressor for pyruvate dehydrogenase complex
MKQNRVSATITRRIQKQIADGRLAPGEKLPAERDLARRLSVSRVSVREAYRSLEELGLLVTKRGAEGGAFITDFDHQPVTRSLSLMLRLGRTSHEDLTEARLLLEPPIARLAAERADPSDIELLEDLVRKQQAAIKGNGNPRRYDLQFHRLVAQCAKNLPLLIVMNSLADLALEAIAQIDIGRDVKKHVIDFHTAILDAIRRRDGDAAYEIMLSHVHDVQSRLRKALVRQRHLNR